MRTTEQRAPEAISELIPKLTMLTTEQPTTAEIEEAILISKAITRALFEWVSWRYSNHANGQLNATHPEVAAQMAALDRPAPLTEEDIASPELDEEFDRIERAHPEPGFTLNLRDLA